MELAVGFGAKVTETIVSRAADEVVDTLWRQICYVWNYKSNIQELNQQLNNLKNKMTSLQHEKAEEERKGKGIEDEVMNWLESARVAVEVAEKTIEDHMSANKNCCMGCCPNLNTRYKFSREATKHTPVFAQVQVERSSITNISYVLDVQNLQAPKNYEVLDTRTDVLNKVMSALKNVDFNLIGVYGPPGVGKTTLATQHLVDEVKRVGVFEVVTWASVTQTANVNNIQEQLAAWLGLNFDVESLQVRAVRLCDRLKREDKVLVILDDIWESIGLEVIGIPNDKDSKGCKVFMTSRNQDVLSAMGVQEQFVLKDLEEDEAWKLFQTKLGDTLDSDLQPIAFEVSKRCAGLPGLITAVATSLRNQDLFVWKDSLEGLKQFDHKEIKDQVNSALKLSYDFLQPEAKSVFLLCGQNGAHNIDIKYLFKYGLGLGIFQSCKTVEAARNRLHSLLKALKASCLLLESGNKDGLLQMHDLVHHFAITNAPDAQPVITSNIMNDWPEDDILENCEAMVLKDGKIPPFSGVLNCHKLRFFLLNNKDLSLEVGDNFFGGMKGLRVLNLTKTSFLSLPGSLQFLKDLQTLCLDSCVLEDVTLIGELKKLQVLSLVNCTITCLPREIGNLINLKLLDLKDCSSLEVIEPNVLSKLTRLEELYMENSFVKWEDNEASNGTRVNANLSELEHLSKLTTVRMHIVDSKMLPKDLELVKKFQDFKILIGEEWDWNVEYKTSRTLKLKLNTSEHVERVKSFLMRTEDLYLGLLKGVESVVDNLDGEGFPHLKHLLLQNSQDIRYIIGWRWVAHITAFPKLESLVLNNLNKLETISASPNMRSFGSLRRIKVGSCNLLRNLFSFSMLRSLVKLEEFDVSSCKIIKSIVGDGANDDGVGDAIKLEQLQTLTLDHLPHFASFSAQVQRMQKPTIARREIISADEHETPSALFNDKIEFPNLINLMLLSTSVKNIWSNQLTDVSPCTKNLTSLIVDGCWNLGFIFTSSMVRNLAQLEKLEISNCSSLRAVVVSEDLQEEILFLKLDHLKLKQLPKLESFCSGNLIECPLLSVLRVESCPNLHSFVSSSIRTDVGVTALFDKKVSFPMLEELQIFHMHRLGMIWKNEFLAAGSFEKLQVLKVEHAKRLLQLFPTNMLIKGLRNLDTVVVKNCDLMEQVFDMEELMQVEESLVLPLRTLVIDNLQMLKHVWNRDRYGMETLSWNSLASVTVGECPSLKSLFPASIAIDLPQLEVLNVSYCPILEEVVDGGLETSPTLIFPKLTFLSLWKLDELRNFYPGAHSLRCPVLETLWMHRCPKLVFFALDSPMQETQVKSTTGVQPLFSFTELVPNLKQMSLSYEEGKMINQGHVPTQLFHRLEELELECFHDQSSYLPFDLLRRFKNMKKLHVSCSDFEELFPCGLAGDDQNVAILTQIRLLKLDCLTKLRHMWNQGSHHKQVLQNLETLKVYSCDELISILPSFASFQCLQTLDVISCDGLMNLFESRAAKSLVHLRTMSIKKCNMVTEIVAIEGNEIQTEITLSKLESLKLHCLKNITCFSLANCPIKFPSLTEVIVTQCPKMKFFSQGNLYAPKLKKVYVTEESDKFRWVGDLNSTIQQLYVEMAGFDGMQNLELSDFPELMEKWLAQLPVEFFSKLTSLVVDDCAFQSVAIPSELPPFLIALEKLEIRNCAVLEELYDLEWPIVNTSIGYLSNLKKFQLIDLPKLRHVWDEIPKDILDVKNLTLLKFHNCSSLRNILTSTMCLGLVKLKNLQVTSCQMLDEIIAPPSSKDSATALTVVFPSLECIIFEDLPNLTSFYSRIGFVECPSLKELTITGCPQLDIGDASAESKVVIPHLEGLERSSIDTQKIWNCQILTSLMIDGLRNLKYLFPSSAANNLVNLKKVEISNCRMLEQVIAMDTQEEQMIRLLKLDFLKLKDLPKLTQFSICNMLECPNLKELQIENCPQLKAFVAFASDSSRSDIESSSELQLTTPALFDEKVAFPNLGTMQVMKMDSLRMIWSNHLHSDSFSKLQVLKVENNGQLMEIFPHHILARLQNLNDLVIKNCDSLQEVFDIHGLINAKEMERVTVQLKRLDIRNLLNLSSVWNEDPKGVISFDEISSMHVWDCPNLNSLFPLSIAKGLQQLELLELDNCGVVELVTKDEEAEEEALEFVFPRLKRLDLWRLEKLEFFFRGIHTLGCPVLGKLSVHRCDKLEVFTEAIAKPLETQRDKSLLSFSKIIPNLEDVSLTSKDAVMIKESKFLPTHFDKLKLVELNCFHTESDAFPSDLLKLFHNMESLYVRCSMFKELFPGEGLEEALQTLKLLKVELCGNLISLAPLTASFQNLTSLNVTNCKGLVRLMGFSTARSLVQLQKMTITNCEEVSEIVSNEESDEESKEKIVFTRLQSLELNNLRSLVSFCSAECSFEFPSLTQVIVSRCPNIKFFSKGVSTTPELKMIQVSEADKGHWNGDLNTTVKQLYLMIAGFDGMQHLELSNFPELKEKWLCMQQVEVFYKLTSLVVNDCAFQSVAIPSNLLPVLITLEKLEIKNCDLLEGLFDLELLSSDRSVGYLSNLKEIQLIDLPWLRHVWDEIPKDTLDVKNLTSLKIHNCSSLRSLLSRTMCLGLVQLKTLQITSCQMIEEVIAPPASKYKTVGPTIVFPSLECIIFKDLPNIAGFYSGNMVECPCLKEITVAGCPQLDIGSASAESKAVIPHLGDLSPSSIAIQKIWNRESLTSLTIDGLGNVKFLISSFVAKSLVHLKKVVISNCGMLEQVIATEGQDEPMMRLLNLDVLKLKDLPKLAQFCTCHILECASLKELQIENCPQLTSFVSNSTSSNIVPNSELQITTPLFDEKVVPVFFSLVPILIFISH
ncbi:Disease resistance protein At4g27190 [Euphorbia peplus]|nr:Disease resistance protein At4g27190 [Euphorbia peplus]